MRKLFINSITFLVWAGCFSWVPMSCVTRDLEPIGAPLLVFDSSQPTDTGSNFSTDSYTLISTATGNHDTSTGTTTTLSPGSDSDTETDTNLDTATQTETDTATLINTVTDTDTEKKTDADTATNSDVDIVKPFKFVGSATQGGAYPHDFFEIWDQVTPENAGKWGNIEAERNVMNWDTLDSLYGEAMDKGIRFKAHTLLWHIQQPAWLFTLKPAEQAAEVEEWIAEFCAHYPDMEMINVVVAPTHDPPFYAEALGGAGVTGYDWVVTAFEMARTHCPNAKLLIEEYNALIWQTFNTVAIAAVLNERDLLDGIGCAANSLTGMPTDDLVININTLMAFGLPIYIGGLAIDNPDNSIQLYHMKQIFPVLYNHPAVAGITFWGYVEGQTFAHNAFLRYADGTPRPALIWLTEYLAKNHR